jgi:hypothetical protein
MRLERGPAAYDRNYYLAFLMLCVGLGAYFLYDYKIGYPNRNLEEAQKNLVPLVGSDSIPDQLPQTPTKTNFENLAKTQPTDPAAVRQALGDPLVRKDAPGGQAIEYYVSLYGMARVPIANGRVLTARMNWISWGKNADDIQLQLYCAIFVFAVAIFVFYRVYRAATLHALIDDAGMTYGGRRIPFENMKRLCDYTTKGWVDLYYDLGGEERRLRIDNQKIREFDEIIDALCEIKGFEDPRKLGEQPEPADESKATPEPTTADAAATPDQDADEEDESK